MPKPKPLTTAQRKALLEVLQARFEANPRRHPRVAWAKVMARLDANPGALPSLHAMEQTGGEPDVVAAPDTKTGVICFMDCSVESPAGRRSLCYDGAARRGRKAHPPTGSAMELAAEMGVELLTEAEYRHLQTLGAFDTRTSSWIATPPDIRSLGGALFCDRRYDTVFLYHNGADSYYAARGFRASLRV